MAEKASDDAVRKSFSVFRKIFVKGCTKSVLQTNTGGRVEYTKAIERTILKELCNTTGRKLARCPPCSSNVVGRSEYR
jgi:Na+-translocating ferredoxin:NAD+ oxidoreductase RNF subunit RnfB